MNHCVAVQVAFEKANFENQFFTLQDQRLKETNQALSSYGPGARRRESNW
jgi:hypothetical protein